MKYSNPYYYGVNNITTEELLGLFKAFDSKSQSDIDFAIGIFFGTIYRIICNTIEPTNQDPCNTNLFVVIFCFLRKYFYGKIREHSNFQINLQQPLINTAFCIKLEQFIWAFIKNTDADTQSKLNYILKEIDIIGLDNLKLYDKIELSLSNTGCRYPTTNDLESIHKLI